jgi:hypothetical protein
MPNLDPPPTGDNERDRITGSMRKKEGPEIAVSVVCEWVWQPDAMAHLIGLLQRAHVAAVEAGWCDGDGP